MITCRVNRTLFHYNSDLSGTIIVKPDNQKEVETTIAELAELVARTEAVGEQLNKEIGHLAHIGLKTKAESKEEMRVIPYIDIRGFVAEMVRKSLIEQLQKAKQVELIEHGHKMILLWMMEGLVDNIFKNKKEKHNED